MFSAPHLYGLEIPTVQFLFYYSDSDAFFIIAYSRNGVKGTFVCSSLVDKNNRKEQEEGQSLFCCRRIIWVLPPAPPVLLSHLTWVWP